MTAKTTSTATGEYIVKRWTAMLERKDAIITELIDELVGEVTDSRGELIRHDDLIKRARAEVEPCSGYRDFSEQHD